jgi:hypothetical protein
LSDELEREIALQNEEDGNDNEDEQEIIVSLIKYLKFLNLIN